MQKKYKKVINNYSDFNKIFDDAFIGVPKEFINEKEPFYGTLKTFLNKYKNIDLSNTTTVFFMHGSAGLKKGTVYRKWLVNQGFIFFAPNSFKVQKRPTYETPAKLKKYEKVHTFRQAEIHYCYERLSELNFIDTKKLFLMGNSEGGLAAAAYKGKEFKGRVITAYSCENGYYSKDFKIGASKSEPILNIIGTHDEFFSNESKPTKKYEVQGHCTDALRKYPNAKVIILPQTKHDITTNIYVKNDILNFLNLWK
ncbi:MAG: dienelactone hydrolase family protein [Campylobacterota bacterium]